MSLCACQIRPNSISDHPSDDRERNLSADGMTIDREKKKRISRRKTYPMPLFFAINPTWAVSGGSRSPCRELAEMCHRLDNPVSLYGLTAPLHQHFMLIFIIAPSNTVH